jgi:hypothetical protein
MKIFTMKHHAKSAVATALAVGLGFASISASATTSALESSLTFNNLDIATYSHNIDSGYTDFNDVFTFSTNSSTGGATSIASFNGNYFSTGFTSFSLIDVTNGNSVVASGSVGPTFVSQLGFSNLTPNTVYGLSLVGTVTNPNAGGYFIGTLAVNPVPEPGEYLLMLCGLVLLGFLATKRKEGHGFSAA